MSILFCHVHTNTHEEGEGSRRTHDRRHTRNEQKNRDQKKERERKQKESNTKFPMRRRKQTIKETKTAFIILLFVVFAVTIFFRHEGYKVAVVKTHSFRYNLPFIFL